MSLVVLTLIAPTAVKEELVAAMLAHPQTAQAGFIAREIEGYGNSADCDSVVEQVRGHALAVEIALTVSEADARSLLAALGEEFSRSGVIWRMMAATASGTL
ncbi:DUF3240 family protein [Rhodopseudomonas palustris]|uniref:DUF3240 domain-containing protein n=1 Tax=Rhodopseudomonas palustris (strain BisB5) TaxID=316057 RepID=Q130T5_RHOPS|nr:conserved hypothetical protein [Rhodopseudomonas palustris BisB5]MBB1090234.1 DUF3240 family protein [Rhodopseudomonas palustris]